MHSTNEDTRIMNDHYLIQSAAGIWYVGSNELLLELANDLKKNIKILGPFTYDETLALLKLLDEERANEHIRNNYHSSNTY